MKPPPYDHLFKLLLVGDSTVGKSAILSRFTDNTYVHRDQPLTTIGIDFKIKTIDVCDLAIKLQVWDTAGQERFRTITTAYYRGANGVMVIFNLTDRSTFNNALKWFDQIERYANPGTSIMLVGSQCESPNHQVSAQEAQEFAKSKQVPYIEVSAKDNINIEEAFFMLSKLVMSNTLNIDVEPPMIVLEQDIEYPAKVEQFSKGIFSKWKEVHMIVKGRTIELYKNQNDKFPNLTIRGIKSVQVVDETDLEVFYEMDKQQSVKLRSSYNYIILKVTKAINRGIRYNYWVKRPDWEGIVQPENMSNDILVSIFQKLSFRELLKCGLVCKHWYKYSNSNIVWKHRLHSKLVEKMQEKASETSHIKDFAKLVFLLNK